MYFKYLSRYYLETKLIEKLYSFNVSFLRKNKKTAFALKP